MTEGASTESPNAREEPTWLSRKIIATLHDESVSLFGGASGLRDEPLLESALARPKHLWAYGDDPTLAELAASYCTGLVKNHPFTDGNKRVGLLSIRVFLFKNGYCFEPVETEAVAVIRGLAAGEMSEENLAAWIAKNVAPR